MNAKRFFTMIIAVVLTSVCAVAGTDKFTLTDVTYPNVESSNTEYCRIASVTYGSTITMVKLVYNTAKVDFVNTKNIALVDQTNNKTYKLKFIKGLTDGDKMEFDGQRFITLVFPKLKKNPTAVNIVEADGNGFQFYGVDLTQSGPVKSVFDKDALEKELNKNYGNGMKFKEVEQ